MMRSLSSAVSGLKAQQTAMDVIGNNIANVNTTGYKKSTVTFSDLFYETLKPGTETTNSSQVGYGSQVSSISKNMASSGATSTGRSQDVYIDGEGYFAVNTAKDGSGTTYFTRVGHFSVNSEGYLVDSNGNYVLGVSKSGTATTLGNPICLMGATLHTSGGGTVQINSSTYKDLTDITINSDGTISANYNDETGTFSNDAVDSSPVDDTLFLNTANGAIIASTTYATTLGSVAMSSDGKVTATDASANSGVIIKKNNLIGGTFIPTNTTETPIVLNASNISNVTFTANSDGTVTAKYTAGGITETGTLYNSDGTKFNIIGQYYLSGGASPYTVNTITASDCSTYYYSLNSSGGIDAYTDAARTTVLGTSGALLGTQLNMIGMVYESADGVTGETMTNANINDFTNIKFDSSGNVTLDYKGAAGTLADVTTHNETIGLATFVNPDGLNEAGNSYYTTTVSSGVANYIAPSDGNSTTLVSGQLESSNVDLAEEFTNMIVTQRGFQANSRVITVSDSMLEELVNLKRS